MTQPDDQSNQVRQVRSTPLARMQLGQGNWTRAEYQALLDAARDGTPAAYAAAGAALDPDGVTIGLPRHIASGKTLRLSNAQWDHLVRRARDGELDPGPDESAAPAGRADRQAKS